MEELPPLKTQLPDRKQRREYLNRAVEERKRNQSAEENKCFNRRVAELRELRRRRGGIEGEGVIIREACYRFAVGKYGRDVAEKHFPLVNGKRKFALIQSAIQKEAIARNYIPIMLGWNEPDAGTNDSICQPPTYAAVLTRCMRPTNRHSTDIACISSFHADKLLYSDSTLHWLLLLEKIVGLYKIAERCHFVDAMDDGVQYYQSLCDVPLSKTSQKEQDL